jgi:hypothetical protein
MPFPKSLREEVLVRSHRCCCVCHSFAGRYEYVHHIAPEAEGGSDEIDNAIALCERCHGEAGHYNPQHPLGTKYSPSELKRHRDEWWVYVQLNPAVGLPRDPLTISPSAIAAPVSAGEIRHVNLNVNNEADDYLYGVTILLTALGPATETCNLELDLLDTDIGPITLGGVELRLGCVQMNVIDPLGRPNRVICLHTLRPRTVYTLPLKLTNRGQPAEGQDSFVVTLTDFGHEPSPVIQRPSANDPSWTEALVRVSLFDEFYWVGVATKPAQ